MSTMPSSSFLLSPHSSQSQSQSRMVVFTLSAAVVLITLLGIGADAFVTPSLSMPLGVKIKINTNTNTCSSSWVHRSSTTTSTTRTFLANKVDDDDEEEEIFTPTTSSSSTRSDNDNADTDTETAAADDTNSKNDSSDFNFMDDLTPPPVNFSRNSILFSDDPATKRRNNKALDAWKFARTYLPAFVTGAWPWRDIPSLDERPLAALYNAAFVRLPVVAVGVAYLNQKIFEGRDLVMDFGFDPLGGPQAINPVLVIAVLVLILL